MDSRDRIIAELRELVAKQAAQLEQQAKRITDLELQLAKAMKNSSNYSTCQSTLPNIDCEST